MPTSSQDKPLSIGCLIFPGLDQLDFTGPFEVFSRIPNVSVHLIWKEASPVADMKGLILAPQTTLADCPPLDVVHIPGGAGQEALMHDELVLEWIQEQSQRAFVFSVCTGALICGAAGLLQNKRATTHWASFDLLKYFGAIPVNSRMVFEENLATTAGVTAGIDAALELTARLRGPEVAQRIQLYMEYAPAPPFDCGTPETAPPAVYQHVASAIGVLHDARRITAERVAQRLGVVMSEV